jgi:hypothetical protein
MINDTNKTNETAIAPSSASIQNKSGRKRKAAQAIEVGQVNESETVAQLKARIAELEADRAMVDEVVPMIEEHYSNEIGGRIQSIRGNVYSRVAQEVQPAGDGFRSQVESVLAEFGIVRVKPET